MPYIHCIQKQSEVTQKGLAPSPLILHVHICPIDMQIPAKFHEIPSIGFQDIEETKPDGRTHTQCENSIGPLKLRFGGGYKNQFFREIRIADQI